MRNECTKPECVRYLIDSGKVLTVWNPWATLLMLGKDVENRSWKPWKGFRGPLWIHVAQEQIDYGVFRKKVSEKVLKAIGELDTKCNKDFGVSFAKLHKNENTGPGLIIGKVTLYNCVEGAESPWAHRESKYHWIIKEPMILRHPYRVKGKRGLWNPPEGLYRHVLKNGFRLGTEEIKLHYWGKKEFDPSLK